MREALARAAPVRETDDGVVRADGSGGEPPLEHDGDDATRGTMRVTLGVLPVLEVGSGMGGGGGFAGSKPHEICALAAATRTFETLSKRRAFRLVMTCER